jgi:hypothetical protein
MTIFRHFAERTVLPVKIDEIADWIKSKGFANEIRYHPLDRPPNVVAALVRVDRWRHLYGIDDYVVADIPYSTQLDEPMQRVAAAKELSHILDGDEYVAKTYGQISTLISEVVIPLELLAEMAKLAGPGMKDHSGILAGLALLVPLAARNILFDLYEAGHIGVREIATVAHIPEAYAEFVMTERWGAVLERICKNPHPNP